MNNDDLKVILIAIMIIASMVIFSLNTAFWLWLIFGQENKVFIVLTTVYIFIILISLFGDYEEKELERQKKDWERIIGKKYE